MKNKVSPEVEIQAMKIARGTQKIGQTKEQTKLIAQGIEKGIAEYKKQHGKKTREIDKQRKVRPQAQVKSHEDEKTETVEHTPSHHFIKLLPWGLLALSWISAAVYLAL